MGSTREKRGLGQGHYTCRRCSFGKLGPDGSERTWGRKVCQVGLTVGGIDKFRGRDVENVVNEHIADGPGVNMNIRSAMRKKTGPVVNKSWMLVGLLLNAG